MTTIAGHRFDVSRTDVEQAVAAIEPEPIDVWSVVVGGRRYTPKQVVEAVTGLDRADFNSHQARSLLTGLGFAVGRRSHSTESSQGPSRSDGSVLDAYVGRWVAQVGDEILYDADSPHVVVAWLYRHHRRAVVWQVPSSPAEVGSTNVVAL